MENKPQDSSASWRIAESIRSQILAGKLEPGARLRQEDIAEEFGASRQPVRDALKTLESDGLVTLIVNSGAWVSKLSEEECIDAYQIRERLEPLLIRQSIPSLTSPEVSRLEVLLGQMMQATEIEDFLHLDREFHLLSYAGSKPGLLRETVERLWNTTQHYRRAFADLQKGNGLATTHLEHQLLFTAIRDRDLDQAELVLVGHIRRTRTALSEHREIFNQI